MGAAGQQVNFQQGKAAFFRQHLISRPNRPAVRDGLVVYPHLIFVRILF